MPFVTVPVFSNNDAADLERLNTMVANLNYLNDNKVKVSYNAYGVQRTDGIKLACGTTDANNPNGKNRNRWVSTGNFFTPGTRPVAVATNGSLYNRVATTSVAQRTGESPILDHTGFQCLLSYIYNRNLKGPNYINWIMMGY